MNRQILTFMCLIVFGYKTHPDYYLVMAANRDEFYKRPTRNAGYWDSDPDLLAGRDLKSGGTWLGVHRKGRFSAVTNYRDIPSHDPDAESRGYLVTGFLQNGRSPDTYLEKLKDSSVKYNGFNLLTGSMNALFHYSNQEKKINQIEPGVYAISNALLNTPWPKVEKAKAVFESLSRNDSLTEKNLFDLLTDTDTYPVESLPETGLPADMEQAVSACFIRTPDYGTRCSTLLFIGYDGSVRFSEQAYRPGTLDVAETNSYSLQFTD